MFDINTDSWWFAFSARYNKRIRWDSGRRNYANTLCSMIDNVAGGWIAGLVLWALVGIAVFSLLIGGFTWVVYGFDVIGAGLESGGYLSYLIAIGQILSGGVLILTVAFILVFALMAFGAYVVEPVSDKVTNWRHDRRQAYLARLANPQAVTPATTVITKWWQDRKINLCSMVSYDGRPVLPEPDYDYND